MPPFLVRLAGRTSPVVFSLFALLLAYKLSFYFSAAPITGWDTVGHFHLAERYRALLGDFRSLGYDPGWFQGFPLFYFYPPFFYFVVAQLDFILGGLAGLPFAAAFNAGLFATNFFSAWRTCVWRRSYWKTSRPCVAVYW